MYGDLCERNTDRIEIGFLYMYYFKCTISKIIDKLDRSEDE